MTFTAGPPARLARVVSVCRSGKRGGAFSPESTNIYTFHAAEMLFYSGLEKLAGDPTSDISLHSAFFIYFYNFILNMTFYPHFTFI